MTHRDARALLHDALATLTLTCEAVGIPHAEWHSDMVGAFTPHSIDGYVGRLHAHDEQPATDPPAYLYDLHFTAPMLTDRDAAAQRYAEACLTAGWQPFSDFASGEGTTYRRTIYFTTSDGAKTGLVLGPNGTFQSYASPLTTDARILEPGAGTATEPPVWRS